MKLQNEDFIKLTFTSDEDQDKIVKWCKEACELFSDNGYTLDKYSVKKKFILFGSWVVTMNYIKLKQTNTLTDQSTS